MNLIQQDEEESFPYDRSIDEDLNDVLNIADNFADICYNMQAPDLSEFNFRKIMTGDTMKLRLVNADNFCTITF